jgi:hypothetical protein
MTALTPGDLVAFSHLPDATWFEVLTIDGYAMTVREAGTDDAAQRSDTSLVKQRKSA